MKSPDQRGGRDVRSPSRFADQKNALRIAAKLGRMFLCPSISGDDVLGARRPSMLGSEAIVGDHHYHSLAGKQLSYVFAIAFVAANETAAVKEQHQRFGRGLGRAGSVYVQALARILAITKIELCLYSVARLILKQRLVDGLRE